MLWQESDPYALMMLVWAKWAESRDRRADIPPSMPHAPRALLQRCIPMWPDPLPTLGSAPQAEFDIDKPLKKLLARN